MTYQTQNNQRKFGGYRNLRSYQQATLVYDLTVEFCDRYMTYKTNKSHRTYDQMVQAARSGQQNIAEGSKAAGASRKSEYKLVNVARASLEELLNDYENFLRQKGLTKWKKDDPRARTVRELAYKTDRTDMTYRTYMTDAERAANMMICLINQTNYLLDKQLSAIGERLKVEGDFPEELRPDYIKIRHQQRLGKIEQQEWEENQFTKENGLVRLANGVIVSWEEWKAHKGEEGWDPWPGFDWDQ